MFMAIIAALYAAQIVTAVQLPRHEGHDDNPASTSVPVHYVYITDYTTVYPQPLTTTLSSAPVPSSSPPIEHVYITQYTTVYLEPSTSDLPSTLAPKRTETVFVTVTVPLNATISPSLNSLIAWNSTSHYVYGSPSVAISTEKSQYGFGWPTPRSSSEVQETSSTVVLSTPASTPAGCRAKTRSTSPMVMLPSSSDAVASPPISSSSVLVPAPSTIENGDSTAIPSSPASMPTPEPISSTVVAIQPMDPPPQSSTAIVIQPVDPPPQSSTAVVVVPITDIPSNIVRAPPIQTSLEDVRFTIQTIDVPDTLPTFVPDKSTTKSTPTPKPSSTAAATPSRSSIATVISADRHCPYPYPHAYCGEAKTTIISETKTKQGEPSTTKGAEAIRSVMACPYPGQRC